MTVSRSHPAVIALAALTLFTALAGDFWRDLISWWGWGVLAAALMAATITLLVRSRRSLPRMQPPVWLALFLGLSLVSIAWSAYRGASAIGVVAQLGTAGAALFLALALSWSELLRALSIALRWVIGLSLLFEAVVALVIGHRILPLWVDYGSGKLPNAYYWSRDHLFTGGQIQGIVGNSNLLAMCALLALIVFGVQLADARVRRTWGVFWVVLAAICFVLARSSTVIIAAAVTAVALAFALWARRRPEEARRRVYLTAFVALVGAVTATLACWDRLTELFGKSEDLTGRTDIWHSVIGLAVQRPAFGWGWVGYWAPWAAPFKGLAERHGVEYLQAHEAWLDVWLQLGIVGLVAFVLLVLCTLWRTWFLAVDRPRLGLHDARPYSALALLPLLIMAAFLAQSLAESRLLIESGWLVLVTLSVKSTLGPIVPDPIPTPGAARMPATTRSGTPR